MPRFVKPLGNWFFSTLSKPGGHFGGHRLPRFHPRASLFQTAPQTRFVLILQFGIMLHKLLGIARELPRSVLYRDVAVAFQSTQLLS